VLISFSSIPSLHVISLHFTLFHWMGHSGRTNRTWVVPRSNLIIWLLLLPSIPRITLYWRNNTYHSEVQLCFITNYSRLASYL